MIELESGIVESKESKESSDIVVRDIKKKKKQEFKMTEEEKEANRKILKNMAKKQNYKKNPRFSIMQGKTPFTYTPPYYNEINHANNPFVVEPQIIVFRNYLLNNIYQIDLKLINRTHLLTNMRCIPPNNENFSVKGVIYPKKDSSLIAPGMNAIIEVIFNATSLDNFDSYLEIQCEQFAFKVPIKAVRDEPALKLNNPLNCGSCLVGDNVHMMFRCINNGCDGHFRFFLPQTYDRFNQRLESPKDNNESDEVLNIAPFSIFPREFYLYKGMGIDIFAVFNPEKEGFIEQNLMLSCDSKIDLPFKVQGHGTLIELRLTELDNNPIDESELKLENIFFGNVYPYSSTSKTLKIKNYSPSIVKYHWGVYNPDFDNKFNLSQEDEFFSITPIEGSFKPEQEIAFEVRFNPKNALIYEQKLEMIVEDIPFQSIKGLDSGHLLEQASENALYNKSEPFMIALNSPYPSYPLFTFNLVGSGNLCHVQVNPSIIDFGDVYLYQLKKKTFTITNASTNVLSFKLREIMQVLSVKGERTINPYFREYLETKLCNRQVINSNKKFDSNLHNEMKLELGLLDHSDDKIGSQRANLLDVRIIDSLYDRFEQDRNNNKVNFLRLSTKNLNKSQSKIEKSPKKNKRSSALHALKKESQNNSHKNVSKGSNSYSKLENDHKNTSVMMTSVSVMEDEVEENAKYTLKLNESIEFCISFNPNIKGAFKSSIVFNVPDGVPVSVEVKANVIGPSVSVGIPFINFGLLRVSEIKQINFKIKNTSQIPFRFLLKESRYKNVDISNYLENNYLEEVEGVIREPLLQPRINNYLDFDYANSTDVTRKFLYNLKFSKVTEVLQPQQEMDIAITFVSPYPLIYKEIIEVLVENSDEITYINAYGDIQNPVAYLSTIEIHPSDIYVNVPIAHEENIITLVNPSNIPINFSWNNVFIQDDVTAEFYPSTGMVPPKSSLDISYKVVYFQIRDVDDLFICNIKELDLPLGFELKGKVTGLDIIYELTEEAYNLMNSKHDNASVVSSSIASFVSGDNKSKDRRSRRTIKDKLTEVDKTMKMIEFKNLKVNRYQTMTFIIKNESGIHTNFNLKVQKYAPGQQKNLRSEMMNSFETESNSTTSMHHKSKKGTKIHKTHSLLNDEHEKYNFSSAKGKEFTKQRQIENDSILYLTNRKGVAVVVNPTFGQLEPHSEQTVTVSIFNECVGDFEDELVCDVKGLPTKFFPVYLKIRGNPLQLSPFQPGIDYASDPPLLKMGHVLTQSNILEKSFKLLNTSANPLTVEWKIYDYRDVVNPKNRNIFKIKIEEKKTTNSSAFKLLFNPVEPKEFQEMAYTIEPKLATVQSKAIKDFKLSFIADEPGPKSALIVAYPKFDDANTSSIKLSELTLKIDAGGVKPHITVDKNVGINGFVEYEFVTHSYGISPKAKRSIVLINQEKISLIVKLAIEGPFKITNVEPKSAVLAEMVYNIMPNTNLTVDVRFLNPSVKDEVEWPMTLLNEKFGKLFVSFENGEYQEFFLRGTLKRPRIKLSTVPNEAYENTNFIDFGYVNVESKKIASIWLLSETDVDTKWKINYVKKNLRPVYGYKTMTVDEKEDIDKTDDPEVFIFSLSEGIISGPSLQLKNIPLGPAMPQIYDPTMEKLKPIKIDILFKPKKKVFYKSLFKITSETGNVQDFILKGFGSYLEEHF